MVNFIEFPIFTGVSGELRPWISELEDFFVREKFTADEKMNLTQSLLEGEAEAWFYRIQKAMIFHDWEELKDNLLLRFGDFADSDRIRLIAEHDRFFKKIRDEARIQRIKTTSIPEKDSIWETETEALVPTDTIPVTNWIEPRDSILATKSIQEANSDPVMDELITQNQVPVSKLEHSLQIHNESPNVCENSQDVVGCDELGTEENMFSGLSQTSQVWEPGGVLKLKEHVGLVNQKKSRGLTASMFNFKRKKKRIKKRHNQLKCNYASVREDWFNTSSRRESWSKNKHENLQIVSGLLGFTVVYFRCHKEYGLARMINWRQVRVEYSLMQGKLFCKNSLTRNMPSITVIVAVYDGTIQIRVGDCGGSPLECVWWRLLKHCQRHGHGMQAFEAENKSTAQMLQPRVLTKQILVKECDIDVDNVEAGSKKHSHESFGSKGLAYDGCVILRMNFAGFGRGTTDLLHTEVTIHTEIEENLEFKQLLAAVEKSSQEVIEELAKRIVIEQKIEGGLLCGDVKFHLKHKWRFKYKSSFTKAGSIHQLGLLMLYTLVWERLSTLYLLQSKKSLSLWHRWRRKASIYVLPLQFSFFKLEDKLV